MELESRFTCPVCGNPGLLEPAYDPQLGWADPSYEICSCCGFEYGFTDLARGYTHEQWRCEWIRKGMPWRWLEPPPGWDPREQLRSIGVVLPPDDPPVGDGTHPTGELT